MKYLLYESDLPKLLRNQNHIQIGYAWYSRRAVVSFPVERSSEVTLWRHQVAVRFLPITFDRKELETWGWCHSVCLVKAMNNISKNIFFPFGDLSYLQY